MIQLLVKVSGDLENKITSKEIHFYLFPNFLSCSSFLLPFLIMSSKNNFFSPAHLFVNIIK